MIQVIRLAIRRLAEIENILTSPPPKKGLRIGHASGADLLPDDIHIVLGSLAREERDPDAGPAAVDYTQPSPPEPTISEPVENRNSLHR